MEIPENNAAIFQSPANKNEHLNTLAKSLILAKIAALVCVLVIVLGYFVAMNTSIEKIPVVRMSMEDTDDFDETTENFEELLEEIEDDMEDYEDELEELLSKKERKQLDKMVDTMKDTARNTSIRNMKRLANIMTEITDDASETLNLKDARAELDEATELLNIITTILLGFLIIGLFFTVLGALRNVNGLVVVGAILTTLFCILFCGILLVILNLAAHIALIYLQRQYKKEFKAYRAGALNT